MGKMMIGERLKKMRTDRGWSQGTVADKIGVATSAVSMYENDQREPSLDIIEKLANIYGVSVDVILGKNGQEERRPIDMFVNKDGMEFGFSIARSLRNGKTNSVNLMFDRKMPVLQVDGLSDEFASAYAKLQPEDKIAVCKEMLRRAKDELMRGM